mgnify:CR=1 FL=1
MAALLHAVMKRDGDRWFPLAGPFPRRCAAGIVKKLKSVDSSERDNYRVGPYRLTRNQQQTKKKEMANG